jgi:hypothetical protein
MDMSAQGLIFGVNEAQSVYWETLLADTLRRQTEGSADGYALVGSMDHAWGVLGLGFIANFSWSQLLLLLLLFFFVFLRVILVLDSDRR